MSKFLNNMTVDGDLSVSGGISSGTVTATQFSYLSGATSNIQQQITNLTNNTTGKLLSTKEDIVACTDSSYFASATAVKEINNNLAIRDGASAGSHNAFYVPNDITSWYQDGSLWDRIQGINGYDAFEGIYPGMTFDMSRNITAPSAGEGTAGVSGYNKILILGCNCLYNNGYYQTNVPKDNVHGIEYKLDSNHIVVCPYYHFGPSKMNSTATTTGGYDGSLMNQSVIGSPAVTGNVNGTINEQLYAEFGNHLKTYKDAITTSVATDVANKYGNNGLLGGSNVALWRDIQASLMTEIEVYGSVIFSSTGFDTGGGRRQFPAFFYNTNDINQNYKYWLKDVVNKTMFCVSNASGIGQYNEANFNSNFVRPKFILG